MHAANRMQDIAYNLLHVTLNMQQKTYTYAQNFVLFILTEIDCIREVYPSRTSTSDGETQDFRVSEYLETKTAI
jgi:hypothetical protein